jgi:hypothetical protein
MSQALNPYPFNPFPWKHRDSRHRTRLSPQHLRAILSACELDIHRLRAVRAAIAKESSATETDGASPPRSLRALVIELDTRFGGIVPSTTTLAARGHRLLRERIRACGGVDHIRPTGKIRRKIGLSSGHAT